MHLKKKQSKLAQIQKKKSKQNANEHNNNYDNNENCFFFFIVFNRDYSKNKTRFYVAMVDPNSHCFGYGINDKK